MEANTTYSKMGLFHIERNSMGFIGRYLIEGTYVKKLERDFWADNTLYQIYPLMSEQKQFEDYCFSQLAAIAPEDIFSSQFTPVKTFYVPMVLADDKLLCLYNNDNTLAHSLLNNGSISASTVADAFGEVSLFDPQPHELGYAGIKFLSMMLTLKGASYVAKINDVDYDFFNAPSHSVFFVPVYSMSFKYNGEEYTLMSLADANFTGFTSNLPLPEDPFLTQKETKYRMPWVSICFLILATLGVTAATVALVVFVLKKVQIDIFFKIVLLALPIYVLYAFSTGVINFFAHLFESILMPLDRFIAGIKQKKAINRNFARKRADLNRSYSGKRVTFPEVSSVAKIDKDTFKAKFKDLLELINNFSEKILS